MADKVISTRIPQELYAGMLEASALYLNEADFVRAAIRNEILRAKALHAKEGGDDFGEWVRSQ